MYKIKMYINIVPFLGRLSFYSGHSAFGMYCMLFLSVSCFVFFACELCVTPENTHKNWLKTGEGGHH